MNYPLFKAFSRVSGKEADLSSYGCLYNGYEIRLCTGMCDSNEEPIYDGDIVILTKLGFASSAPESKHKVYQKFNGLWVLDDNLSGFSLEYNIVNNRVTLFKEGE